MLYCNWTSLCTYYYTYIYTNICYERVGPQVIATLVTVLPLIGRQEMTCQGK